MKFLKSEVLPEMVRQNGVWVIEPFRLGGGEYCSPDMWRKERFLYVCKGGGMVKVGISDDPKKRAKALSTAFDVKVFRTARVPKPGALYAEEWLHRQLAEYKVRGEWYDCDPRTAVKLLPKAQVRANVYFRMVIEEWRRTWAEIDPIPPECNDIVVNI